MPRFHCPRPLAAGQTVELPGGAARHAQVLRLQPGSRVTLFDGSGGEFEAVVEHMGRREVRVMICRHVAVEREASRPVQLAVAMPANDRMDWLVEKATELGAAGIQPLVAQRSVLKLEGERAGRKRAHWQGIAVAACEQCGRNRVPAVFPVLDLHDWLGALATQGAESPANGDTPLRLMLSLGAEALPLHVPTLEHGPVTLLSGPEGGFGPAEEAAACAAGFRRMNMGPRVLRAETAPLAALVLLIGYER
jgi:16S rRNA (uracil1498-N3)-methyltransferase